jgi:hypothetical protein
VFLFLFSQPPSPQHSSPASLHLIHHSCTRGDVLSPSGANCAPPTYVGRVLSSIREASSRHTFRVWGPCSYVTKGYVYFRKSVGPSQKMVPGEGLMFSGSNVVAAGALGFLARLTVYEAVLHISDIARLSCNASLVSPYIIGCQLGWQQVSHFLLSFVTCLSSS